MSGKGIFVDTNIIIYLLQGNLQIYELLKDRDIWLSVISEIELLSHPGLSVAEAKLLKEFLSQCRIVEINRVVKEKTIEIKKTSKLKLPDALIAASAHFIGLPLLTADRGFKMIKDVITVIIEMQ